MQQLKKVYAVRLWCVCDHFLFRTTCPTGTIAFKCLSANCGEEESLATKGLRYSMARGCDTLILNRVCVVSITPRNNPTLWTGLLFAWGWSPKIRPRLIRTRAQRLGSYRVLAANKISASFDKQQLTALWLHRAWFWQKWANCRQASSQQTQNICITFVQRRPNVFDVGPTLYKCYTNVLC